jgi:glycine/D-amino acid oxidase-like deaminating enzyme
VRAADKRIAQLFPQIGQVTWEYAWSGWLAMTRDEYPRLHELAPGVFAALGYSGRGLALATVLGRELARHLAGADPDSLVLPLTKPSAVGLPIVNHVAVKAVVAYKRMRDAIELRSMT